ncbi:MAG: hypothetical protein N3I35_03115 [Clostridia bacterium]|nr:hypothetical protein [Clostridia bacterium]
MRVVLIGDNQSFLAKLESELNKLPQISSLLMVSAPSLFAGEISKLEADAAFIDMDIPSGIKAAKKIQGEKRETEIVFMFESNPTLIDICKLESIFFLSKPLSAVQLEETINNLNKKNPGCAKKIPGTRNWPQVFSYRQGCSHV